MDFCDFACEWASPQGAEHAAGGCRREIVLYCKKYAKLVTKNAMCIELKRQALAQDPEYQRLFGQKRDE